jgi:hypothetical protein
MRIIISTVVLSLAATRADAAPAWCKSFKHDDRSSALKTALDPDRYPDEVVKALVQGLCDPTVDERAHQAELEAARQQWMKRMAMNEADWAGDVMACFAEQSMNYQPPLPNDKPWSSLGAYDQYALLIHPHENSTGVKHYLADALSLTATGRFGYVWNCLHNGGPVEWAICQPDIDALDRTKLGQELRADTAYSPEDRMRARFELAKVDHFLPKHVARVQALFAKDRAYKQLFDLARDTRAAYEARAKDLTPLRALVLAMDDARVTSSRSALAGCSDKIWPAFAAAVAKLPATSFENVRGEAAIGPLVRDPETYLAANALLACEGSSDQLLWYLKNALEYWPGFRGPRTAAITAITAANIQLDDRREKLSLPYFHFSLEIGSDKSPYSGQATGVIAKVTARGDAIEVSFVKTSEMEDHCLDERETNKIVRIDSDGNLIRERVCTKWAKQRTDTTPQPVTINKRYGGALQKGRYVSISDGTPLGVWAKPNSPLPIAVFGVQLGK